MHAWASPLSIVAGIVLVIVAPTTTAKILSGVYALAVIIMFTTSAVFHRLTWTDEGWWRMRQADQTAIYLMIAGSYTGIAGMVLTEPWRTRLLIAVWIGTAIGVAMVWLPFRVPFGLNTAVYVIIGALVILRLGDLARAIGPVGLTLILIGLFLYLIGGMALGARVPNPIPGVFGYHEVWHLLVTVSVVLHYCAVLFVIHPRLAA